MTIVNRVTILVTPKQRFLEWLHAADSTSGEVDLEDIRREPNIYLLPECDGEEEMREDLRKFCGRIFEAELDGWYRDRST